MAAISVPLRPAAACSCRATGGGSGAAACWCAVALVARWRVRRLAAAPASPLLLPRRLARLAKFRCLLIRRGRVSRRGIGCCVLPERRLRVFSAAGTGGCAIAGFCSAAACCGAFAAGAAAAGLRALEAATGNARTS